MSQVDSRLPNLTHISVIIPVKNEEATISPLLKGLFEQTYRPAEIVIVDGGSTDRTRDLIRNIQQTSPITITLIETSNSLPGRGRNLAIAKASNEWIASIDAGIVPSRNWLEELVKTATRDPSTRVIFGNYEAKINSYFSECAAITYLPDPTLPTRSIASCLLHRSSWEVAGRFREDLRSGEDVLFFRSLDAKNVHSSYCPEAMVVWELRPDMISTFRRFVTYSRNGMKAGLGRDWQLNVTRLYSLMLGALLLGVFIWPFLLLPPLLLLFRAQRRIWKWYRKDSLLRFGAELLNPRRLLMVTWINVSIDVAAFCGVWQWFIRDRGVAGIHQE